MYSWVAFPLLRITLLFTAGIVLAVELPPSISRYFVVLILIGLFALYLFIWLIYQKGKFFSFNIIFGLLGHVLIIASGYALLLFHNDQYNTDHIIHKEEISAYQVKIIDDLVHKEKSIRLLGELIATKDSTEWIKTSGKLYVYIRKRDSITDLSYGDVLLIRGSPAKTQSSKNPGEFDYKLYLSYQNIFHQDFIHTDDFKIIKKGQGNRLYSFAIDSRRYLKQILHQYVKEDRERVIAFALLLGTKEELTPEINQAYASAGAMHVLAVSGLHVGIIYGLILFFFKKSHKRKVTRWVFLAVALLGLWSYALITGLSASVLRAVTMFSLMTIAKVAKRESNIYNTLSAAGLILLCYDPYMIMAVGFQLSFLAVFGIVYITPKIYHLISVDQYLLDKAWQVTCVSIAAQIATAPLVLLYFHQFPSYFFLSNLVVIPAAFAILVSGISLFAFEMIPFANDILGWVLEWIIYLTNEFVFLIERLPNNTIDNLYINTTQSWLIIVSIMFFFGWRYYRRLHSLILLSVTILVFVWIKEWRTAENLRKKEIVFYSIGQHTAIDFIQGNRATLITDSALLNNESKIRFHIKPKRLRAGIDEPIATSKVGNVRRRKVDCGEVLIWNGARVLVVSKPPKNIINSRFDVVVISKNSIYDLSQLNKFQADKFILDASNKPYRIERMVKQSENIDMEIIDISLNGSYTIVI